MHIICLAQVWNILNIFKAEPKLPETHKKVYAINCLRIKAPNQLLQVGVGVILPRIIILPDKTDPTFKDLVIPNKLCIVSRGKAWIDKNLMGVRYGKVWLTSVCEKLK